MSKRAALIPIFVALGLASAIAPASAMRVDGRPSYGCRERADFQQLEYVRARDYGEFAQTLAALMVSHPGRCRLFSAAERVRIMERIEELVSIREWGQERRYWTRGDWLKD